MNMHDIDAAETNMNMHDIDAAETNMNMHDIDAAETNMNMHDIDAALKGIYTPHSYKSSLTRNEQSSIRSGCSEVGWNDTKI